VYLPGYDIGDSYKASRSGPLLPILQEVEAAPEFGTNTLRWLRELDLAKLTASRREVPYEPCHMDYVTICYMASMDSALDKLDLGSRQRLYRLAVWDADYFLSREETMIAAGPVGLIYGIAKRPEGYRGSLPAAAVLMPPQAKPSSPLDPATRFTPDPANLRSEVATAKAALELRERP
jgi:hypothetical protein